MELSNNRGDMKLKFKKPIITSLDNPISSKELLTRLQVLTDELSSVQQEKIDRESIKAIGRDLVNKKLLKNSNVGVQTYVCCGLADILRIYAPDAPYTATELSRIFKSFFSQLKKLSDEENAYYQQQCYMLKRLADVRSLILITDLPDSQQLLEALFKTCYELATKGISSKLEPLISGILSEVIAETDAIPVNVLKMMLASFLNSSDQSESFFAQSPNMSNPGLRFAISVCENNSDRMARQIAQYFSEMLYEGTTNVLNNEANTSIGSHPNSSARLKAIENLKNIHKLSVQIWKAVPELLDSVICMIDDELNAEDEQIRWLATETIGRMIGASSFTSPASKVNFVIAHKNIWLNWLKKTIDLSPSVRCKWVESVHEIVNSDNASSSTIALELSNGLTKCLLDTHEKVRLTACMSISKIHFDKFTSRICNKNIMKTLLQLLREKNSLIRDEVLKILGNIYNQFCLTNSSGSVVDFGANTEEESKDLVSIVSENVPNEILSLIYINSKSITAAVDICLFEKLLPFENDELKRVERLCSFYRVLNEKSKKSFLAMCKRQRQSFKAVSSYVHFAEEFSNSTLVGSLEDKENQDSNKSDYREKDELILMLDKTINWICNSFPEGLNTYNCFERLYRLKNFRFFHLIKACVSAESNYSTVKASMKELLTRLTNAKNIKVDGDSSNVSTTDMVSNFKLLLYRSSPIFNNRSNMRQLITIAKKFDSDGNIFSVDLLEAFSSLTPDSLSYNSDDLFESLNFEHFSSSPHASSKYLKASYNLIRCGSIEFPNSEPMIDLMDTIALNGSPRQARYAIKILGCKKNVKDQFQSIVDRILPLEVHHNKLSTKLGSLSEILLLFPDLLISELSNITVFLIKEIILQNNSNSEAVRSELMINKQEIENNYEYYKNLYTKLMALRVFVNQLRSYHLAGIESPNDAEIEASAKPILKLLYSIIVHGGEMAKNAEEAPTPMNEQAYLRTYAGLNIVKLAKCPFYSAMISENSIQKLVFLVQDQEISVRSPLIHKLQKYLSDELISEKFLATIFFAALEPVEDLKNEVISWIKSTYKRQKGHEEIKFEKSIVRLIHMITHKEEFVQFFDTDSDVSEIKEESLLKAYSYALRFLVFFLESVGNSTNCSLIYYLASRIKQYRDASLNQQLYEEDLVSSEVRKIYCVAELAQLSIKEMCDVHNWPLQTWPGKVQLPTDIFAPMTSTKEAHQIITAIYIPDKLQIRLRGLIKQNFSSLLNKKRNSANSKEKREQNSKRKSQKKKRKVMNTKNKVTEVDNVTKIVRKSNRQTKQVSYRESDGESSPNDELSDDEYE